MYSAQYTGIIDLVEFGKGCVESIAGVDLLDGLNVTTLPSLRS